MRAQLLFLLSVSLLPAATRYIGDAREHRIAKMIVDANGYTYFAGSRAVGDLADVYVSRFDPLGNRLNEATFSGKGSDRATALAVDRQGYVYVAGVTTSANWPLVHALQFSPANNGSSAFLLKLSPDFTQIVYSTYFGGRVGATTPNAMATDSQGNVYVAGTTTSTDFPVTAGLAAGYVSPNIAGLYGAFLTKVSSTGDRIVYSTILSGNAVSCYGGSSCFLSTRYTTANAVALDAAGNAYAAGRANVTDLPSTPGAFLEKGYGGFVFEVNAAGTAMPFLTYISSKENLTGVYSSWITDMVLDASGNLVLTGYTTDPVFPTTAGALQTKLRQIDAFVTALRPDGKTLVWSTLLGGADRDEVTRAAVDAQGRIWLAGTTSSPDFPNANGWTTGEEFLAALDPAAMRLSYSARYPYGAVAQSVAPGPGALVSFAGQLGLWTRLTPGVDEPGLFHVTNAAGTQLTTRVVPGEYISLFGPSIGAPGAEVFLGNTPATVIYAGANQINALTPLSLEAPGETTIRVRRGGVDLPVYPLATAVAAPEIFRTAAGSAVLHADGTWNSEANLAHAGDVVSIWLTGASSPVCCSVKVGTTDAAVLYAGLAPGYAAGLWQVNFQLPARVYPNDVVSVTSAGATSSYVVVFTR